MKLLSLCSALAAGEFLASYFPQYAEAWPIVASAILLTMLFGHGLRLRIWPITAVFLLGVGLYLRASVPLEQVYREKPWARGREWMLRPPPDKTSAAATIRRIIAHRIAIGLESDRETASLSRALLLGERQSMPRKTKRLFLNSGTMHVFAISGLHVMAISDMLTFLLALSFLPRRLAGLVSVPILWSYVALIGCPPSAVRAATMATFTLLAPVIWRRPDGLRAWTLAFIVIHLADPLRIVNVGNVLSFAVMLAIVLVGRLVHNLSMFGKTLCTTLAAWIIGVPIAAHVFGCVTPGSMLANLVLIAAAKLTVVTGALGIASSFLSTLLARHVNNLSAIGIRAMVFVADGVSRIPGANMATGRWTLATCIGWYAAFALALLLILRIADRRRMI